MPRSSGSDDESPALEGLPVDGLAGVPLGAGALARLPGVEGTLTEGLADGLGDGLLGAGGLAMLPGEALGAAVLTAASACRLQRSKSACVGDGACA